VQNAPNSGGVIAGYPVGTAKQVCIASFPESHIQNSKHKRVHIRCYTLFVLRADECRAINHTMPSINTANSPHPQPHTRNSTLNHPRPATYTLPALESRCLTTQEETQNASVVWYLI
jgi:hypothetical protein